MPPATPGPGLPVEPARSAAEQVARLRQHARDDVHPVPERRLQRLRLLLGGPPVLGLHRARPLEAQQRQYRRRREDQLDRSEPVHDRAQAREVARGHLAQSQTARGEDVAVARAEGGEQAGSGVVHRGAGEADDEATRFGGQREEEQLAQPEGRGMRGVAVVPRRPGPVRTPARPRRRRSGSRPRRPGAPRPVPRDRSGPRRWPPASGRRGRRRARRGSRDRRPTWAPARGRRAAPRRTTRGPSPPPPPRRSASRRTGSGRGRRAYRHAGRPPPSASELGMVVGFSALADMP